MHAAARRLELSRAQFGQAKLIPIVERYNDFALQVAERSGGEVLRKRAGRWTIPVAPRLSVVSAPIQQRPTASGR